MASAQGASHSYHGLADTETLVAVSGQWSWVGLYIESSLQNSLESNSFDVHQHVMLWTLI